MSASASKKVIFAALAGNTMIAISKFIAAAYTGSAAMVSEGIHSLVDTGNQGLLLYGMKQAKKPADEHYPFGHGKEIYFWSFIVAILIFALGAGISIYEGIHHILHPNPIKDPIVNYLVLVLAFVFEGWAWLFALKEFKKTKGEMGYIEAVQGGKDPTMFVVLFEDSAAMLGLLIALIGIFVGDITGMPIFDGVASVLIGLVLATTAFWLAYETKGLLIGESANQTVVNGIRNIVKQCDFHEYINEILTMHMGPEYILVNLSIDFTNSASASDVERAIADLNKKIKVSFPAVKRVFIEAEKRKVVG